MQDYLCRVYVVETVEKIREIMEKNGLFLEKRPRLGYAINGDHRIYSSYELLGGDHHLRNGIPQGSMAYIELCCHSFNFHYLKAVVEKNLTQVRESQVA